MGYGHDWWNALECFDTCAECGDRAVLGKINYDADNEPIFTFYCRMCANMGPASKALVLAACGWNIEQRRLRKLI